MEVKANNNVDVAQRMTSNTPTRLRAAQPATETTSFDRVAALDQSLQATPLIRTEAVSRAKELIADQKYPPSAAIEGIAALLALKLDNGAEA